MLPDAGEIAHAVAAGIATEEASSATRDALDPDRTIPHETELDVLREMRALLRRQVGEVWQKAPMPPKDELMFIDTNLRSVGTDGRKKVSFFVQGNANLIVQVWYQGISAQLTLVPGWNDVRILDRSFITTQVAGGTIVGVHSEDI